jgi:hypothetical protein
MRKRLTPHPESPAGEEADGFDLEALAQVEVTSEDPEHPIERALLRAAGPGGWRAAGPGPQNIRLVFDEPIQITTVQLCFREVAVSRTQEFVLRWGESATGPFRDIVRQQYHFSPPGTTEELENYRVELTGVKALELSIIPEVSGATARASLERLRLA